MEAEFADRIKELERKYAKEMKKAMGRIKYLEEQLREEQNERVNLENESKDQSVKLDGIKQQHRQELRARMDAEVKLEELSIKMERIIGMKKLEREEERVKQVKEQVRELKSKILRKNDKETKRLREERAEMLESGFYQENDDAVKHITELIHRRDSKQELDE